METLIRRAVADDVDSVYELICELEQTRFEKSAFVSIYQENMGNENIVYFVADIDGEITGFSSVYIHSLLHHCAQISEIQELVVSPVCRGKRIGADLVEKMAEWSRQKGALQLEVTCNKKRQQAHDFYRANGFMNTHEKFVLKLDC